MAFCALCFRWRFLSTKKGHDGILCFVFQVEVFVNKVGPYFNPHETYHYYQLPVCRPDKVSACT